MAVMALEQLTENSTAEPVILSMDCESTQLKNISEIIGKIVGGKTLDINYWFNIGKQKKKVGIIFDPLHQFRNIGYKILTGGFKGVKKDMFFAVNEVALMPSQYTASCCSESVRSLALLKYIDSIPVFLMSKREVF
jgi:hypothetical protein